MKRIYLLIIACCCAQFLYASADSISIYSNAMHKDLRAFVIMPSNYSLKIKKQESSYPVIYLLHGATGNSSNWYRKVPALQQQADLYQVIIVCPDGSPNSWYINSPVDSAFRFETYISKEVPEYIDAHYKTIKDRRHRAIAGLSMGGYGAFFIAFRHADTFGACGSMSGAFEPENFKASYDVSKRFGDSTVNAHYYKEWGISHVVEHVPPDTPAIIFDCGQQDPFLPLNRLVHEKLSSLKIAHDYTERPGKHDWKYWGNAVKYQFLFFSDFFKRADGKG